VESAGSPLGFRNAATPSRFPSAVQWIGLANDRDKILFLTLSELTERVRWQCAFALSDRDQRFSCTLPAQHRILSWDSHIGTNGKNGSTAGSSDALGVVSPVWQYSVIRGGNASLKRAFQHQHDFLQSWYQPSCTKRVLRRRSRLRKS
jgi:hypothetical protein